eukprot:365377-Chlamydomonas_euryale.AAC.15
MDFGNRVCGACYAQQAHNAELIGRSSIERGGPGDCVLQNLGLDIPASMHACAAGPVQPESAWCVMNLLSIDRLSESELQGMEH